MKTKNKMSLFAYATVLMFFCTVLGILFALRVYDEKRLNFFSVFLIWYAVIILAGLTLTCKNHRNMSSAATLAALPYGAYCFIAYYDETIVFCGIYLLIIVAVVILYYFARIFFRNIPSHKERSVVLVGRTKTLLRKSFMVTGVLAAYIFFVTFYCTMTGTIQNTTSIKNVVRNADASSIEFSLSDWEKASKDKKKEYAQRLIDYECGKLYIKPLKLYVDPKMQNHQYGYYINSNRIIALSKNRLYKGNVLEVLNAICHESYHALEYSLIQSGDIYNGNTDIEKTVQYKISKYKSEFENYRDYKTSDGALSFYKYYNQMCESDSRTYADIESVVLYKILLLNGSS